MQLAWCLGAELTCLKLTTSHCRPSFWRQSACRNTKRAHTGLLLPHCLSSGPARGDWFSQADRLVPGRAKPVGGRLGSNHLVDDQLVVLR
eukprot:14094074-Heterocapsa_arctica.AAC.1